MAGYVSDGDLPVDADGTFAVVLSATEPGPPELGDARWVAIPEDASAIVVRECVADRSVEVLLVPGLSDFHPMGAQLGQECVRITGGDFRSMIFPTQYRVPTYNRWLLDEADLAPAYRYHRRFLQHLQSGHPAERWLLKSPAHLWHVDALVAEYPDVVVVQTHLTADAETRMRTFLAEHPGDGGGGGTRYRWEDTGLDANELRTRATPYQDRYGVATEPVR